MIDLLITKFSLCEHQNDLDNLIMIFSRKDTFLLLEKASIKSKKDLAIIIREKIVTLIFLKGNTADREYLYLYGIFEGLDLEPESLLEGYSDLISQHLQSGKFEIFEKILLLEFRTLTLILQGKTKVALKEYIKDITTLNINRLYDMHITVFVESFFHVFPIPIENLLEAIIENLEKDHYFSFDFIARRSIFCWCLHVFWKMSYFYYETQWSELYPLLKILFVEHLKRNEFDEAMYVQFYILLSRAIFFKTQEQWKVFNQEIIKTAEPFYKEYAKTLPLCKQKIRTQGKKIIGILKERAVENSPYKVEWSLLQALMQDKKFTQSYDVKIYMMGYAEQAQDDPAIIKSYQDIGVKVVDVTRAIWAERIFYHSHLEKALAIRKKILEDEVDILIFTNDGYDINDFLIVSRCAPKQIFWSHGNFEYDLLGIDQKISHCLVPKEKFNLYSHFSVPQLTKFNSISCDSVEIERERAKYPKDKIILGTIGRLIKVNSDIYLKTIADIMYENPLTIYLACGVGNVDSLQKKVRKMGLEERFYFPGFVNPHIYGELIDVWLDTFPLTGGQSVMEFMSKGKPLVYLVNLEQLDEVQRVAHEETVNQQVARFFSIDVEDYCRIAKQMIRDDLYREEIIKCVKKAYKEWSAFSLSSFVNLLESANKS